MTKHFARVFPFPPQLNRLVTKPYGGEEDFMPSWLRTQLSRAYREKDKRSIIMLNRAFFKYRRTLQDQMYPEK
jgi:hypothetical protein